MLTGITKKELWLLREASKRTDDKLWSIFSKNHGANCPEQFKCGLPLFSCGKECCREYYDSWADAPATVEEWDRFQARKAASEELLKELEEELNENRA
jgi:hypothetical protein